jgi:hypothetical protein
MNFKCKEISISDEYLGFTVTFSDSVEQEFYKTHSYDEINKNEKYLMLQRTYPEDEDESDYYTISLSDFEKSGELNDFTIELDINKFRIEWSNLKAEIELEIDNKEFKKLVEAIKVITNDRGSLIINE